MFHGVRDEFFFPAKMERVGGNWAGVEFRPGLTERVVREGRDETPAGLIPPDPWGFRPNTGRGGTKRTRPKWEGGVHGGLHGGRPHHKEGEESHLV
jgi:hypothetical protein